MSVFSNLKLLSPEILSYYPRFSGNSHTKDHKISIVGNGGVTQQDNEEISNSDVVIRFNNYATRQGIQHTEDRSRCDILFTHFDLHSASANPKDVVIAIPYPFKIEQVIKRSKEWYPNARLWMVNPYENYHLCQQLDLKSDGYAHPLPSVGLTALGHILNWPAQFYITGYNWYFNESKNTVQDYPITMKSFPSHFNHFYMKELDWMIKNCLNKLNIKFSSQCLKILHHIQSEIQKES